MNFHSFASVFPRKLGFWSLHCLLNSLPSVVIALVILRLWGNPAAITAMFCAIGTFAIFYATLTSLPGPLSEEKHSLSRALKIGTKIRGVISVLFVMMIPHGIMFTPDFWCGWGASILVDRAMDFAGFSGETSLLDNSEAGVNPEAGFFPVFATTLVEGAILSLILLIISLVALLFVQARDRRRFLAGEIQGYSGRR